MSHLQGKVEILSQTPDQCLPPPATMPYTLRPHGIIQVNHVTKLNIQLCIKMPSNEEHLSFIHLPLTTHTAHFMWLTGLSKMPSSKHNMDSLTKRLSNLILKVSSVSLNTHSPITHNFVCNIDFFDIHKIHSCMFSLNVLVYYWRSILSLVLSVRGISINKWLTCRNQWLPWQSSSYFLWSMEVSW